MFYATKKIPRSLQTNERGRLFSVDWQKTMLIPVNSLPFILPVEWIKTGETSILSLLTLLSLSRPSGKSLCCLPLFSCIIFTVFTLVSLKKELLSFFLSLRVLFSLCQMYQVESCVWEETFSLTNSNGFSRFLSWVTEKSASQRKIHKTCLTNNTNHMQRDTSQERMHFLLIDVHVLEVFDFRQDTGNTPLDTIAVLIERTSDANTSNWR